MSEGRDGGRGGMEGEEGWREERHGERGGMEREGIWREKGALFHSNWGEDAGEEEWREGRDGRRGGMESEGGDKRELYFTVTGEKMRENWEQCGREGPAKHRAASRASQVPPVAPLAPAAKQKIHGPFDIIT